MVTILTCSWWHQSVESTLARGTGHICRRANTFISLGSRLCNVLPSLCSAVQGGSDRRHPRFPPPLNSANRIKLLGDQCSRATHLKLPLPRLAKPGRHLRAFCFVNPSQRLDAQPAHCTSQWHISFQCFVCSRPGHDQTVPTIRDRQGTPCVQQIICPGQLTASGPHAVPRIVRDTKRQLTGFAALQHKQPRAADLGAPGLVLRDALATVEGAAQAAPVVHLHGQHASSHVRCIALNVQPPEVH
jgi:hypothetical protein